MFRPDQSNVELYEVTTNTLNLVKTVSYTLAIGTTYDYKITYDRISGELKLWINNSFVTSWIDTTPIATGSAVSLRAANCNFKIDNFKVFRSRVASTTVLVGSAASNDLRNENPTPTTAAGKISSITKDNADNISGISFQDVDIDWTKPVKSAVMRDGTSTDIDTTYIGNQLDLNYTTAKDTNSGVTTYYYAIGTTAGAQNTVAWTANALNVIASETGLSLVAGQKYYTMMKAMNGAGLVSDSTVSDGVLYLITTGLTENFALNELTVYPNPTNDKATISIISSKNETVHYSLTDAVGKLIEQKACIINTGINSLIIDVNALHLSKGVYFINVSTNGKVITKKMVVE